MFEKFANVPPAAWISLVIIGFLVWKAFSGKSGGNNSGGSSNNGGNNTPPPANQ